MSAIAVIGGTGMNRWSGLERLEERVVHTPFGEPSAPVLRGRIGGRAVTFLPRHGPGHLLPPHLINYRANLWALKESGIRRVIAIAAVGGIARSLPPAGIAVPHDLIDYTWGRGHTYADGSQPSVPHVEFSEPYAPAIRQALLGGARKGKVRVLARGVMGVTQGPRLESPAEIRRMRRDGCTMVGMTGMPEAGLARELGLEYASLAVCVNWAAGVGQGDIHGEIARFIETGMAKVRVILGHALEILGDG